MLTGAVWGASTGRVAGRGKLKATAVTAGCRPEAGAGNTVADCCTEGFDGASSGAAGGFGRLTTVPPGASDACVIPRSWLANCAPLPLSASSKERAAAARGREGAAACAAEAMVTRRKMQIERHRAPLFFSTR